jgi:hypothetical protein
MRHIPSPTHRSTHKCATSPRHFSPSRSQWSNFISQTGIKLVSILILFSTYYFQLLFSYTENVLGARLSRNSKDSRKGGYFHFSANRTPKCAHCCTQGDCFVSATLTLSAHIFSLSKSERKYQFYATVGCMKPIALNQYLRWMLRIRLQYTFQSG